MQIPHLQYPLDQVLFCVWWVGQWSISLFLVVPALYKLSTLLRTSCPLCPVQAVHFADAKHCCFWHSECISYYLVGILQASKGKFLSALRCVHGLKLCWPNKCPTNLITIGGNVCSFIWLTYSNRYAHSPLCHMSSPHSIVFSLINPGPALPLVVSAFEAKVYVWPHIVASQQ